MCLVETLQANQNGFRSQAGGITWQGNGRKLSVGSEVPHDVREGLMERGASVS